MTTIPLLRRRSAPPVWGRLPWLGVALPSRRAYRVWQRNRDVFFAVWSANLFPPLAEPVIVILAFGLGLGAYIELTGDLDYMQFLAPGVMAIFPMFTAAADNLWNAYWKLDQGKVYDAILATPARAEDLIAGEVFWAGTHTAINTTLILLVMAIFTPAYHLIASGWVILAIPLAVVPGIIFGSLGLAYTSVARSMNQLTYFFTLVLTPMFWFSGVFFPLDELPGWVETLAWFIPMTHLVDIYRGLTTGDLAWQHLGDLAWLAVVAVLALWLALWAMRRRLVV